MPRGMRGDVSRFHSHFSLKARYVGKPGGICIPRAPGRTFCRTPQDGLQPMAVPLLPELRGILFPIVALFDWLLL